MIEMWYIALFLVGLVLAIVWIILPFAIIGTKPLLRDLLEEQEETNRLLAIIAKEPPED